MERRSHPDVREATESKAGGPSGPVIDVKDAARLEPGGIYLLRPTVALSPEQTERAHHMTKFVEEMYGVHLLLLENCFELLAPVELNAAIDAAVARHFAEEG